jgi:hypothetical protein
LGPIYFEGQKFQEEEAEGCGDEGAEAGGGCFGEKAPGTSFVTAALADLRTDFLINIRLIMVCASCCQLKKFHQAFELDLRVN